MHVTKALMAMGLAAMAASCSGSRPSETESRGTARVSLQGTSYEVRDVSITIEPGDDPWFRIEGAPARNTGQDCVHGMSAGLGLYGDLPGSVHEAADLAGKRLRVEFTGDGDDANFCFLGMGGLAGAEDAWVTIESVSDDHVTFSMTGTFRIFDNNGDGPVAEATASGTAILRRES